MRISHDSTIRIPKGWQTILRLEEEGQTLCLLIKHDAITNKVIANDYDVIETALARETILDRREMINQDIADKIEESLVNWLAKERQTVYRYLRWTNEQMLGFSTERDALDYDEKHASSLIAQAPRKKTITLG